MARLPSITSKDQVAPKDHAIVDGIVQQHAVDDGERLRAGGRQGRRGPAMIVDAQVHIWGSRSRRIRITGRSRAPRTSC